MEVITTLLYSTSLLFFIFLITKKILVPSSRKPRYNLPPSPPRSLPILGHLNLLKQPLHRTFQSLAQELGPIISLKLGVRRVVVVSSPTLVQECFKTQNDIILANRPRTMADKYICYNHTTMASLPYGHDWRSLRRIGTEEMFSPARLNAFTHTRQDEVKRMLLSLYNTSSTTNDGKNNIIPMRAKLSELTNNVIMRMIAGKRYFNDEENLEEGKKFRELVPKAFEKCHESNLGDFVPLVLWMDYGGLKKIYVDLGQKLDAFYQSLLEDHRREKRNTMIGHLLSLQESQPEFYTDQTLKGLISNMIFAATDTSTVTIEWAMSVLLNHPDTLTKARQEIDKQVGYERLIEEQDLPNLQYLRNIILETFRLFPAGPLLLPHESSEDCKIGGYDVPRETILMVNCWAIHRDPELWDEPTSFKPERFDGKRVEDHNQKLMPFGLGRRACPGSVLGQRMVGLALGSLIQCFDWERVGSEEVDLAEGVGLSMPKAEPLEFVCRPRELMLKVLQDISVCS